MRHTGPFIAMERTCKTPAEVPFPPLRQAQYWHCVHGAHRDMAPQEFQEFLGSLCPPLQHLGQGTTSPAHHIVVLNYTGLRPDTIQKTSYKLTHIY